MEFKVGDKFVIRSGLLDMGIFDKYSVGDVVEVARAASVSEFTCTKGMCFLEDNITKGFLARQDDRNRPLESASSSQVGGTHYTDQAIQPLELTYMTFGYEGLQAALYTKVNKYMTRRKGSHVENLEKAIHCLQFQLEFARKEDEDQVA
jgi:hypothetical protein